MKKILFTLFLLVQCSTSQLPQQEKFEGIKKDTLRIFVKQDLSSLPQSINTEGQLKKAILSIAQKRAFQLLDIYIETKKSELKNNPDIYTDLQKILKNGHIYYYVINRDDHYFLAYIDYNIGRIINKPGTGTNYEKK